MANVVGHPCNGPVEVAALLIAFGHGALTCPKSSSFYFFWPTYHLSRLDHIRQEPLVHEYIFDSTPIVRFPLQHSPDPY
jgi:hypothetical protein